MADGWHGRRCPKGAPIEIPGTFGPVDANTRVCASDRRGACSSLTMLRFLPPSTATAGSSDDAMLARRIAAGERSALEEAYRREAAAVYRYALAMCGIPAWAADATQDAFVALASGASTFDAGRGSLGAWLAGVARHGLVAQWRRAARDAALEGPDDGEGAAGGTAADALGEGVEESPEALLVREQDGARVLAALRRLPFAQREALVLVDLQERTYDEAARIAGIELNTLRTRLHRGRARLAQWLG